MGCGFQIWVYRGGGENADSLQELSKRCSLSMFLKVFGDSRTFAIFAEGKFAPSVARMFSKRC
jgi:hypothetical protein